MIDLAISAKANRIRLAGNLSTFAVLGIVIGIIMPLVSALVYPTYTHEMRPALLEWSRLLELPFVVCEILIIFWALRKGMDSSDIWRRLPIDVKIAMIALLFGLFASSSFISTFPLESLTFSLVTTVHMLFAFAIFHLTNISASREPSALTMTLGTGLLSLAVVTAWKFALPPPLLQVPGGVIEWGSALPGFISVRHFGSWTGAIAAAFLAHLLYAEDKQRLSRQHFFFFIAIAMTAWSATRAAVLALVLTTAILITLRRQWPSLKALSMLCMLTGAALIPAWLLLPYDDPIFRFYNDSDLANADAMMSGRLVLWTATLDRWLDSIWLGWGSGSLFWEVFVGWRHTQPHNAVLQFLISWGLIGAAGALWLTGRATITAYKTGLQRTDLHPLLAILFTLLIMSLVEGMLHYPRFIMLIVLCFAVILSCNTGDSNEPINSRRFSPPKP